MFDSKRSDRIAYRSKIEGQLTDNFTFRPCSDNDLVMKKNLSAKHLISLAFFPDPMGEVRKLYDDLGMNLTPQVESAMIHYINNDPRKNVYGKHVYKKGNYFSREFIEKEFKDYIELMSKRTKREDIGWTNVYISKATVQRRL